MLIISSRPAVKIASASASLLTAAAVARRMGRKAANPAAPSARASEAAPPGEPTAPASAAISHTRDECRAEMDPPFTRLPADSSIEDAFEPLLQGENAVLIVDGERPLGVITRADLLEYVAHRGRN